MNRPLGVGQVPERDDNVNWHWTDDWAYGFGVGVTVGVRVAVGVTPGVPFALPPDWPGDWSAPPADRPEVSDWPVTLVGAAAGDPLPVLTNVPLPPPQPITNPASMIEPTQRPAKLRRVKDIATVISIGGRDRPRTTTMVPLCYRYVPATRSHVTDR